MKNIKDYLHLYLGCDCIVTLFNNPEPKDLILTPTVVKSYYSNVITGIKPILRRLSDITDAEFNFLVKERFQYSRFIKTMVENESIIEPAAIYFKGLKDIGGREIETQCTQPMSSLNPAQFLYLLSIGIDLFGLIEAGLAIDATMLNQGTEPDRSVATMLNY